MGYSFKHVPASANGLEQTARFWRNHGSVALSEPNPGESGIPLDVADGRAALSNPENHCMVCGVSGKGKTRRELYPAVILSARAGRSMVIADMKGEIYRNTAAEVRSCGHAIKVINLRNPLQGNRFSPFAIVGKYWKSGDRNRAAILLKDIAGVVTSRIQSENDAYWRQAAQDAIIGFALLLLENGLCLTFDNIQNLFNDSRAYREPLKALINGKSDAGKRLSSILSLDSEVTYGCIVSECNTALSCFVDQSDIRDLLSESDIELCDLGRSPTAVYLICPDESTALYGIASLFIEQCYSELIRYADSREDNRLPVKVDFLLDEFGSFIGSDWPGKLTAARSRGIRFILAIQSMSQLVSRYDENGARTIMANCRTLVYMGGRDLRLMTEISALSGLREDSASGTEKPVLSINDLSTLAVGETVVLDDWGMPYIGHLPDWEAWGVPVKSPLNVTRRQMPKTESITMSALLDLMETLHTAQNRNRV